MIPSESPLWMCLTWRCSAACHLPQALEMWPRRWPYKHTKAFPPLSSPGCQEGKLKGAEPLLLEVHPTTILKDTLGSPYHLGWLFKTVSAYGLSSGLGLKRVPFYTANEVPEKPLPGVTVSVNIPQILGRG